MKKHKIMEVDIYFALYLAYLYVDLFEKKST